MRMLLVAATCLLAAGCMGDNNGSSGNARMTEAEWVEAADKICAEFGAELEGLTDPESLEELGTLANQAQPIAEDGVARLRDLRPPEATEDQVNEWLELNDANVQLIEDLGKAAEDGDETAVQEVAAEAADNEQEADALANELGLTDCADES
jgi:hypothetical protein